MRRADATGATRGIRQGAAEGGGTRGGCYKSHAKGAGGSTQEGATALPDDFWVRSAGRGSQSGLHPAANLTESGGNAYRSIGRVSIRAARQRLLPEATAMRRLCSSSRINSRSLSGEQRSLAITPLVNAA